ncbi:MAG: polysaccharide biosynthesis tyrosine autokinase [Deltaproteobacteria bacterium]|nr:polysaccharide biosynthesis tyrosine autokinase [Deltaproteobacteria bacterium]
MTELNPTPNPDQDGEAAFSLDFSRYFRALRRYLWLVIALVAIAATAAVFYTRQLPEIFEATASIQIEPKVADLLGQGNDMVAGGGAGADYYRQQRQVLGSVRLQRETVIANSLHTKLLTDDARANLTVDQQLDLAANKLHRMMTIKYPEQDRIMYVVVRNTDARLAMEIANAHVATYDSYSRGLLDLGTQQASNALSSEFGAAEKALREADAAIYQYQKDNDLLAVSLESKQSLVSTKIGTYSTKFDDAHSKTKELESRLNILKQLAKGTADIVDTPILSMAEATGFDSLRANYYTAKSEFEQVQREVGPKSIEYAKSKSRVESLRSTLEAEAKRVVGATEKQHEAAFQFERTMSAEVDKYTKEALELGPKIVSYNALVRAKKSAEDAYNILVARLSTSEMSGRLRKNVDTNVRPLDAAQLPTKPVSPSMRTNVVVASTAALVIGLGFIMLIVFLDRTVKSTEDAQSSAGAPVLGIVPMLAADGPRDDESDRERDMYVHSNPNSQVAEACRSLRTNIVFSGADRQLKTLVVSSANPREGKTTLVMYLGTALAQSGQRVLLVDTDMRRPRLHVSTGVSRGIGVSNLIVGDGSYEDAIKSTGVPNLFVLPCGPLPPNPAELLMSKRFLSVLEELKKRFDRIILDSPPLGAVTDAVVLSKHTDGVAIVVRAGKTLREEVKRAARQIRAVDGQVVGVIVNQFDSRDRAYGYYHYQYYGYAEKDPAKAS